MKTIFITAYSTILLFKFQDRLKSPVTKHLRWINIESILTNNISYTYFVTLTTPTVKTVGFLGQACSTLLP